MSSPLVTCRGCGTTFAGTMFRCPKCGYKLGQETPTDFTHSSWYCAECPLVPEATEYVNKYHLLQHLLAIHGENDPKEGVDYFQGWQARKKYAARRHVAEALPTNVAYGEDRGGAVTGFLKAFADPNYGPDDFLADVGLDAPEEPPCDPVKKP